MATYVPAFHAQMGDLDYFVSVVTLGEVARLIDFVEDVDEWTNETPPALKLQRKLNTQRVERELVPYLLSGKDHFYSALAVEIRPAPRMDAGGVEPIAFDVTQVFPGGLEFGMLTLDGTETLYALDGQHRLKSIELAIRQQPRLAREHISLIMIPFQSVARSQTLFSDLNRYAKPTSKSISLLFTHRDGFARVAKRLAETVPILHNRVNMESTSLSSNSRHFITLSTLYEMTKTLAGCTEDEVEQREPELPERIGQVWGVLTESIDAWSLVAKSEEHPAYLRQRELCMHGVAQQAIAVAAKHIIHTYPVEWQHRLTELREVDWRLTNPEWQGIAVHGGRVNNTSTSVRLLSEYLERKIGVGDVSPSQTSSAASS
jgi:DNA sulfur modification protein DndB